MAIVSKQDMINVISSKPPEFVERYIGRALVAIFERQTQDEKSSNTTSHHNNIGFASCDANTGSLTAKYFLKHGKLQEWMINNWTKDFRGSPRICKYHRQLNEIAEMKKAG